MFALGEPAAQMGERAEKVLGKFCDTDPLQKQKFTSNKWWRFQNCKN